ncbi:MAG: TetR/AcrR family transcriptional regulator C-terminal domain-containing protein [Oscillospiraceae bacterium]|nr:TetR/AcrR family transcriptional regulator C-terminal domain-containing protein [Oscillospiraceae bacterium]
MFSHDRTKLDLAEALKTVMRTKAFDKISVSDIISECGISRRTFYYHFQDKQDLLCWYFDYDVCKELGASDIIIDKDGNRKLFVNALLYYMYERREFYANALASTAQNGLRSHLFEYIYRYRRQQILNLLDGRYMDPFGMKFLAEYFTHAIVGIILNWANDGMNYPPDRFDRGYKNVTTICLEKMVDVYAE